MATVDRSNGNITIKNPYTETIDFDFYQFSSAGNSLNPSPGSWLSLHDQIFQPAGAGDNQQWQEAGGSSTQALGEVYLDGNSTFAGMESRTLGAAYNNLINGQDLVFQYRLPTGELRPGYVEYIWHSPRSGG